MIGSNGGNAALALTTSAQALVNNPAGSGVYMWVHSIIVANVDGANNADVTISLYSQDDLGGTPTKIAHGITVPAKASLIVLDEPIYLDEDQSIGALASANGDLEAIASWQEVS